MLLGGWTLILGMSSANRGALLLGKVFRTYGNKVPYETTLLT